MRDSLDAIRQHYETVDENTTTVENVMQALAQLDGPLTVEKLAGLDQFHAGGLDATRDLAELAGIDARTRVLDAGSGLGGPARYLANAYGCQVTGVDLTPSFVQLANFLAAQTGLADLTHFEVGDLRALRFPDRGFDVIWTQHVVMNIRDRAEVYREFHRLLAPGGRLVFFDVFAPDEKPALTFPVPWAESPQTSFLFTQAETIQALAAAGFTTGIWNDVTEQTQAALTSVQPSVPFPAGSPQALTLITLMGPRFREMMRNLQSNIRAGLIRFVRARYEAAPEPGQDTRQ